MRCSRPLATTHPELLVVKGRGYTEYRVYNSYLARDGSGRTVKRYTGWTWTDALVVALVAMAWPQVVCHSTTIVTCLVLLALYLHTRVSQVVYESVIALPPHGLQFETHRGFGSTIFFVSRHFIPRRHLHDFVINEGLRGWNVRYYLAAMIRSETCPFALKTAYENILPHSPVLSEVCRGIQAVILASKS